MRHILENSEQIHSVIKRLFSKRTRDLRRVIIVAYVGGAAPVLLPNAEKIQLYCCPQRGATSPNALRQLRKDGAEIHLVNDLHMKLYWVQNKGFVITSANLSYKALSPEGQKEIGVYIEQPSNPESEYIWDIDKIIDTLNHRPLTSHELARLQREHDDYWEKKKKEKKKEPKTKRHKFKYKETTRSHEDDFKYGHANELINIEALQRRHQICICRGDRIKKSPSRRIFIYKFVKPYETRFTPSPDKAARFIPELIDTSSTSHVAEVDEYLPIPGKSRRFWEEMRDQEEFDLWDIDEGPLAYFKDKPRMLLWILRVYEIPFEMRVKIDFKRKPHGRGEMINRVSLEKLQTGFRKHKFRPVLTDAEFERKKEKIVKIAGKYRKRRLKKIPQDSLRS